MKILFSLSSISLVTVTTILGISSQALAGEFTTSAIKSGSYYSNGDKPAVNNYLVGKNSANSAIENRNYFVFNIPIEMNAAYRTILSSQLTVTNPSNGYVGPANSSRTFNVTNVTTSTSLLQTGGNKDQNKAIFDDLGVPGGLYGSTTVNAANNNKVVTVNLGSNANADIQAKAGSSFAVGGALTLVGMDRQALFVGSSGASGTKLQITFADAQAGTNGNQHFGNVLVGQSSTANITVTNTGEASSLLSGSIDASSNPLFMSASGSQSFTNLASGNSATRTFTFTPTQRSNGIAESAIIGITSNTRIPINNPLLTAFGVAPVNTVTPGNINAGYVRLGTTDSNLSINVLNSGDGNTSGLGTISNLNGTVSLTGSPDFSTTGASVDALNLGDGESQDLSYAYTPTVRGANTADVTLAFINGSDDGTNQAQTQKVTLTGYGVGPEFLSSIAPGSTIDFGGVAVGQMGIFSLLITNNTEDPTNGEQPELSQLTLLDSLFEGSGASAFSLLNFTPGTVLFAGQSLMLQVAFTPLSENNFQQAVLRLLTDQGANIGGQGQNFAFNVQGIGIKTGNNVTAVPEPSSILGVVTIIGTKILFSKKKKAKKNS